MGWHKLEVNVGDNGSNYLIDDMLVYSDPAMKSFDRVGFGTWTLPYYNPKNYYFDDFSANVEPVNPAGVSFSVDAGENVTITSATQANTTIQGMVINPNGDALQYRWLENTFVLKSMTNVGIDGSAPLELANTISLGTGDHTLTLEGTDGSATTTDTMILTVNNSQPTVAPNGGGTVQMGTDIILQGEVADYDGDPLNYKWFEGPGIFTQGSVNTITGGAPVNLPVHIIVGGLPLGQHVITLQASDGINLPVSEDITLAVIDTTVPTLQPTINPAILWPPNHKMVDVILQANVADNSGQVTLSTSVASSEPPQVDGSGNTIPDFTTPVIDQVTGVITLQLRAERGGQGLGRTYTITVAATDDSGNVSTASVNVIAPHDRGK
jgi:hypothetical protein